MPTPRWAPADVLDLDSIASGSRCVGYARSKGRKCHQPIAYANCKEAVKILQDMSRLDPQSPRLDDKLEELATRLLCKRSHRDQMLNIKEQWLHDIEDYVATGAARREEESIQQTHTDPVPSSPHAPSSQATHHHEHNPSTLSLPAEELASQIPGAFPREVEGECCICREDLIGDGVVVHCRAQCGQNIHADCVDLWHASQEVDERTKTCPHCRTNWAG